MARPKNLTVQNGTTVFSLSPSKFKEYLAAKAAGTALPGLGKSLGEVTSNVATLDAAGAATLLAALYPVPVVVAPAPATEPAPAGTVATA